MRGGLRVVDAHQHVWSAGSTDHDWDAPDTMRLDRDFTPDDLDRARHSAGVDASVLVQTTNNVLETEALLDLAGRDPGVAGVVGWAPLGRARDLEHVLEGWADRSRLCGLRHLTNLDGDMTWLLRPEVLDGLAHAAGWGLTMDVVPVCVDDIEVVVELADRVPDLRLVVDHLARPPITGGGWEPWASTSARLAAHDNVAVKLSVGLAEARRWDRWRRDDLVPYLHHALECFGPGRAMAASNWPVVLLAAEYDQVWRDLCWALAELSDDEQAAVLGRTATSWYGLAHDTRADTTPGKASTGAAASETSEPVA